MFNAFASGVRPEWIKKPFGQYEQVQSQPQPPSNTTSTAGSNPSLSPQNSDNADLQALWASFFPQGSNNVNGNIGQTMNNVQPQQQFSNLGNADMSPFNMFATNGMTNANFNTNANMNVNVNDKMAFRDNTTSDFSQLPQFKTGYTPGINGQTFDWGNDSNDFLASLMGNPDVSAESQDVSAEDAFTAQLQKLLDQSGTGAAAALNSPDQLFGMPNSGGNWMNFGMGMGNGLGNTTMVNNSSGSPNAWSPSNYLNMSPFASSGSASASDSPSSNLRESSASLSNSASPEPNVNGHMPMPKASSPNTTVVQVPAADPDGSKRAVQNVFAAAKRGDVVHVVGEDGQILKPSDVWVRMGMHHSVSQASKNAKYVLTRQNQVSDLLIDDLCDQMKEKATCKDGMSIYFIPSTQSASAVPRVHYEDSWLTRQARTGYTSEMRNACFDTKEKRPRQTGSVP
jgi:AP-1-like factor